MLISNMIFPVRINNKQIWIDMCSVVKTQLHARYNCEKYILEIRFLFKVSNKVKVNSVPTQNVTKPSLKLSIIIKKQNCVVETI